MAQLKPLILIANRLYRVQIEPNCYVAGIEAPDARTAMAKAESEFGTDPTKYAGKSLSAECEPIYEASIGLETDGRDNAPNDVDTENGVFEIKIRGCDPNRVNEVKAALMMLIGGPCVDDENLSAQEQAIILRRAIDGMMVVGD